VRARFGFCGVRHSTPASYRQAFFSFYYVHSMIFMEKNMVVNHIMA
jgi:hypothetical protein